MNWKTIIAVAVLIWCAYDHQEKVQKEISWMEKQGCSAEEIQRTLEDENPPQEDESDYP